MTFKEIAFSRHGRINRATYCIYTIGVYFLFACSIILGNVIESIFNIIVILYVILAYSMIVIQVKRWHDRNKSGWWVLINFIPVLGLWAFVENGFLKGDEFANDYGFPQN